MRKDIPGRGVKWAEKLETASEKGWGLRQETDVEAIEISGPELRIFL